MQDREARDEAFCEWAEEEDGQPTPRDSFNAGWAAAMAHMREELRQLGLLGRVDEHMGVDDDEY